MGRIIDLRGSGGSHLLCPKSVAVLNDPIHATAVRTLNAFYNKADKDEDGEMAPEMQAAYYAASEDAGNYYMNLYEHAVSFMENRQFVTVKTYYFMCPTCGFVLPATSYTNDIR